MGIIGLATILVVPLFAIGLARAEQMSPVSQLADTVMKVAATDQSNISDRIQERKTKLKTQLPYNLRNTITSKCVLAQSNIAPAKTRIATATTNRSQVYSEVVETLSNMATKLKTAGNNADTIDSNIVNLKSKIDTFNTDLAAYSQAVSDLADMECTKDPVGFKATLDTARDAHKIVVQDSQMIHSYVESDIKPSLAIIKQQMLDDNKQTKGN
ncbi:MAG: hypothetical protein ABI354_03630 [Candidatus Saccharimonadales bacterium]